MSQPFVFDLPVYLVGEAPPGGVPEPGGVALVGLFLLRADGERVVLPVFTDQDAAEQFRDEHTPDSLVLVSPDAAHLLALLRGLPPAVGSVGFDLYRVGYPLRSAAVGDVIRHLERSAC